MTVRRRAGGCIADPVSARFSVLVPAVTAGDERYNGIVGALAFLYAGVGNTRAFENMLSCAIEEAAKQEDTLLRADVSIELSRERDREELLDRWDAGEITKEELLEALDDDPTLLFEKRDGGETSAVDAPDG